MKKQQDMEEAPGNCDGQAVMRAHVGPFQKNLHRQAIQGVMLVFSPSAGLSLEIDQLVKYVNLFQVPRM